MKADIELIKAGAELLNEVQNAEHWLRKTDAFEKFRDLIAAAQPLPKVQIRCHRATTSDTCKVIQVIETGLLRRGKGIERDPVRIITQYWSLDGTLLWEVDPFLNQQE